LAAMAAHSVGRVEKSVTALLETFKQQGEWPVQVPHRPPNLDALLESSGFAVERWGRRQVVRGVPLVHYEKTIAPAFLYSSTELHTRCAPSGHRVCKLQDIRQHNSDGSCLLIY